ncbi:hypothetical protein PF011_g15715 [Phytophthora fragariae]|uniref:SWIM-type domain-containing protein n=3 Tax=Phytophthora fragariae TaxID=53985 RepID=A0A6A3JUE0_9STRA|nr:hypothetical protein PF011_g15715 [Phytophthora fragariae]
MRSKPEFGKISSDDAVQIDACIHKLVYADSDISYETAHFASKGLCERIGNSGFFDYFEKNWHDCQDRWVMHRRADLPHFQNHTNNRLESFFGKLKDGVDGSKSMAVCVKTLVAYDRRVENEYRYRLARIGQFVHSGYDEEMANVLRFTTPYVAGKVAEEYAFALDRLETYTFLRDDEDGHILHVDGGKKSYVFRDDDWRCDCEFSVSMRLPCHHVIAFLKSASAEGPVIPWASIDERWTSPLRELKKVRQFSYERYSDKDAGREVLATMTQTQRYAEAHRVTQRIASELSDIDETDEFRRSLDFLEQQWRNFRQKTCEVATPREPGAQGWTPQKQRQKTVASEKEGRKWFDAAEAGRKTSGDVPLRRLSGVLVKFAEADAKKTKFKRMKNPVLIQDAFYILPAKLLDACMAVLPVANTEASAISVDEASQDAAPTAMVETIHIKDVGAFSRTQIETFKRCQNLKTAVQLGIDMHKWLSEEGLPSLPAQYHDLAREVARDVLESYPYKEVKGLSRMPDYKYTMLYRLTPPTWMTDAAIRACCERLVAGTGTCRFAGELTGRTMTKKTRSKDAVQVDVALRNRIMGYAKESAVESIFVPVNFMNAHWCCLVIKVQAKRI